MTPDEKGAFCKVCNKSVHDFTKKEPEQIKTILIEEISAGKKVCGRFNEDQIEPTPIPIIPLDTWSLNFQRMKKFALALFVVFGTYLFNSVKVSAQKMGKVAYNYREPIRGEIAISKPTVKDTVKKTICEMPKGDVKVEPIEKQELLGKVSIIQTELPVVKGNAVVEQMKGQVAIIETPPPAVTGSVAITEEPVDIIEEPIEIVEDTLYNAEQQAVQEPAMIMGMMVAEPYDIEPPTIIDPFPSDSIQNIIDGEFGVPESTFVETEENMNDEGEIRIPDEAIDVNMPKLECYPNPSSNGEITLRYNLMKDGMASISLFDLKGNLVKTFLPSQVLYASSYETKYDVSDLNDGLYFCELISGNNKTTARIVIEK